MLVTNTLCKKTCQYWFVSQCWSGRSEEAVTTEAAIDTLRETLSSLNPVRPLATVVVNLQHAIIMGREAQTSQETA